MRHFAPTRFLLALSLLMTSMPLLAASPSARYETRMAYDTSTSRGVLFGGLTAVDTGTKQPYYLGDTWLWTGSKWQQAYPRHAPAGRSGPAVVFDSIRNHVVLFGGHTATADANDTWHFDGNDWIQVNTPNAPPARYLAGAAYDSTRDRVVIFGGTKTTISGTTSTATALYDTWEFDGTTWRQIGGEGPHVAKPTLVYDVANNKVLMIGIDDKGAPLMYEYNASAGSWNQLKPTTMPVCVNEGYLVYDTNANKPIFSSGVCTGTTDSDNETLEWDGSNWTKLTSPLNASRVFGAAYAFDSARNVIVQFGGTPLGSAPWSTTYVFVRDVGWIASSDASSPGSRSLFTFTPDVARNTIWLFGGIDDVASYADLWKFQNGVWQQSTVTENAPTGCATPNAALDTDRQKLVIVCADSSVFEWDGEKWATFSGLKTVPPVRRFRSMTYDQTLKKIVLFGGFDDANYSDETWTWNGTEWTRVKNNPAPSRQLATMWWDPTLKKTVMYGGLGRLTSNDRIIRYDDMWTFDGNGWTQLKPASGTPGMRYGAQFAIDPRTNRGILFGGLRTDTIAAVPPSTTPTLVQVYADDTWEWDGTAWTKKTVDAVPPARENGGLAYDPTLNVMVMYGGYAGHFLSDMWTLTGNSWRVRPEPGGGRRRAVSR
jgi:hypothetical protein